MTGMCHRIDTIEHRKAKICKPISSWLACGAGLVGDSVCRNYASKRVKVYSVINGADS